MQITEIILQKRIEKGRTCRGSFIFRFFLIAKDFRNSIYDRDGILCCDQLRTFELPGRIGVSWTPQKILVVKHLPDIVPEAIAGVPIDHTLGVANSFVGRVKPLIITISYGLGV